MNNNSADDPILDFDEQLTNAIKKSLAKIGVALNRIRANIEKYAQDNDIEHALHEAYELIRGNTDIYKWTDSFSEQEKSVLLLLFYTGRQIPWETLSIEANERRKDVVKIAYNLTIAHNWLKLDSSKSETKDGCFQKHITCGGRMPRTYIESTLSELGIPFKKA